MPELKSKVEELCRLVEASDPAGGLEKSVDATTQSAVVKELEEQIATLQVELNALRSTTPEASEAATKQPDKATLRKQVEQAFDVRQQLHKLEAQKLRLKLQLIETNLESRLRNRDGIIERRVEELFTTGMDSSSKQKTENPPTHHVELLVFTAAYCGPCQEMNPILTRMIKEGLPVRILEITTEMEQTRRFKIERITTFVVTMDGQESTRLIGLRTEAELRQAITVSTRKLESEAVTTSPVELPDAPRDPLATGESTKPRGPDSDPVPVTAPAITQNPAAAVRSPPSDFRRELRSNLATVDEERRLIDSDKARIATFEQPLEVLIANGVLKADETDDQRILTLNLTKRFPSGDQQRLDGSIGIWEKNWSRYQACVRLLRLDVDTAKASFATSMQKRDQLKQLAEKGPVSKPEIDRAELQTGLAEIHRLEAEEMLKLYTDIEKNEPQLNPDYKAP